MIKQKSSSRVMLIFIVTFSFCWANVNVKLAAAQLKKQKDEQSECFMCADFIALVSFNLIKQVKHSCETPPLCCFATYVYFLKTALVDNFATMLRVLNRRNARNGMDKGSIKEKIEKLKERVDSYFRNYLSSKITEDNFRNFLDEAFGCKNLTKIFMNHIQEVHEMLYREAA